MNLIDALSGVLHVHPGSSRPHSLVSTRPDWAETLTRGRFVGAVPAMLASVYSLCGHAHRLCAELALQAATGCADPHVPDAERTLQHETVREHVRRIGLDWTQGLAAPNERAALTAASAQALHSCPALLSGGSALHDTRLWLEQHLLGMPASAWLARWERERENWLAAWSESTPGWLSRLLLQCRSKADVPTPAAEPLRVHAASSALRGLAGCLRDDACFTRQPLWHGACAETGSWARLHDAAGGAWLTPWQRLGARLAELARLSLPDARARSGSGWLASGALILAPGEGMAWVEMARGLLVHHVLLERAVPEARVAQYRVLAPTEWNFHPQGAVAQALEALPCNDTGDVQGRVVALMAAYDPCVRFDVKPEPRTRESVHA